MSLRKRCFHQPNHFRRFTLDSFTRRTCSYVQQLACMFLVACRVNMFCFSIRRYMSNAHYDQSLSMPPLEPYVQFVMVNIITIRLVNGWTKIGRDEHSTCFFKLLKRHGWTLQTSTPSSATWPIEVASKINCQTKSASNTIMSLS